MKRVESDELGLAEILVILESVKKGRDDALKIADFSNAMTLSFIHKLIYVAYIEDMEEDMEEDLEPERCPICNGIGEDPRTEKICTSCHGQGWKSDEYSPED
jgi:hypothetical protein